MSNYRDFSQLRLNELTGVRHGLYKPRYELTDGQFVYGELKYTGWLQRKAALETGSANWQILPKGVVISTLLINDADAINVGKAQRANWLGKMNIYLNNGFEAIFTSKKVFSRTCTLRNDQYGDILKMEQSIWNFQRPFKISLKLASFKSIDDLPLLILLSVYMALLRQQKSDTN